MPTVAQVVPGASVSIVLKIDQGTGREVQGFVGDVLTSGNHPRGIKVRLRDGRVGRVQSIVPEDIAKAGSEELTGLGRNGEGGDFAAESRDDGPRGATSHGGFGRRYRDVRTEDGGDQPPAGYGLDHFLPAGHPLLKDTEGAEDVPVVGFDVGPMATCPVCNEFEGDEAAVAHHVSSHFD